CWTHAQRLHFAAERLAVDDLCNLNGKARGHLGGQLGRRKHAPPRCRFETREAVGTLGNASKRALLLMARARRLPAWTCARVDCTGSKMILILPASKSLRAGALPL